MIDPRLTTRTNTTPADSVSAIRKAADATGVDFGLLLATARRESGLDANAKASTSSATGLFQFTNDTWLRMVDRYGERHGLADEATRVSLSGGAPKASASDRSDILALRNDPELSARMAAELMQENAAVLESRLGRPPSGGELYVAHFLGGQSAARLIEAAERNPDARASDLFPGAAAANPAVFNTRAGEPLTNRELVDKLTAMIGGETGAAPQVPSAVVPAAGFQQVSTALLGALLDLQAGALADAFGDGRRSERDPDSF